MVGLSCGVPRKNLPVSFDLPCKAQAVLARVSAKASEKEASEGCSVALLLAGQIRVSGLGGKTHRKINRTTRTPILRVQHLHCVPQWVSLFCTRGLDLSRLAYPLLLHRSLACACPPTPWHSHHRLVLAARTPLPRVQTHVDRSRCLSGSRKMIRRRRRF